MEDDDTDLVIRAQAGDPEAFARLVERHRAAILRLTRRFARRADDAQDLAQETFVAAFQHLSTLREPEKFVSWLHRIALNAARQWWRREGQISLEPLWDGADPVADDSGRAACAAEERLRALVRDALEALPPEPRSVVLLHYFDGYDYGETAALLDVPVSTVRGRLHLARRRLKKEMAELAPQKRSAQQPQAPAEEFSLSPDDLVAFRGAEMFTSTDAVRPVLQAICIEPDGTLVSSDTHRLYVYQGSGARPKARVLVSRGLFSGLEQDRGLQDVTLSIAGSEAILRFVDARDTPTERVRRVPVLLEGRFPNYERVIPTETKITALLGVRDLLAALDEVARFESFLTSTAMPDGQRLGRRVTLTLADGLAGVLVRDGAFRPEPLRAQWSVQAEIPATLSGLDPGGEFTIAFNRTYLRESLQALAVAPDERIEIGFNGPLRPTRIQPEATENRFVIVMPMCSYLPEAGKPPHP